MNRLPHIDVFRGLLLLMMLLNHVPGPHRFLSYQSIGFFNAAEGLVFISGLVAGLSGFRLWQKGGHGAVRRSFSRRSGFLYVLHLGMVLGLVALGAAVMAFIRLRWGVTAADESSYSHFWLNMLRPLYESPVHAWSAVAIFLYQPPFLDILPMYCLFLALAPLMVHTLEKRGVAVLLGGSFLLWIAAQKQLCVWLTDAMPSRWGITGLTFDPLAWQFLFVVGLTIGFMLASGRTLPVRSRGFMIGCVALVATGLLIRYTGVLHEGTAVGQAFLSRSSLGLVRLIDTLSLIALAALIAQRWPATLELPWVRSLGQNSLAVFIYHVVLIYCIDFWVHQLLALPGGEVMGWGVALLAVLSLSLPPAGARVWQRWQETRTPQPVFPAIGHAFVAAGARIAHGVDALKAFGAARGVWTPTSRKVALGLAIGTFIALTPTIGIQLALATVGAFLLRAHLPSAVLPIFITNPLTAHYLYPLTRQLGAWVLGLSDSAEEILDDVVDGSLFTTLTHGDAALWIGSLLLSLLAALLAHWWGRRYGAWFWQAAR